MPPSTHTSPANTAKARRDAVPYPAQPHSHTKTNSLNLGHDKPLPPIPSIRDANALEVSLQSQRDVLHPSFQTTVLTVQTKRQLIHLSKFLHPGYHTYAEPHELSCNQRSLPPPYTAVDPTVPPCSSRTVRWVHRPINNPHKCRGNIGLGLGYPLDALSNTNHVASTHGQAPVGRLCCFFRRCKKWLQGTRNT